MIRKRGSDKELENVCPVCGKTPKGIARCLSMNSFCEDGHDWHLEKFTREYDGMIMEVWFDWVEG
jgi:hypothetical protein